MPEETQTEAFGEPEATEQDSPPELPDDPAERASALEAQLAAADAERQRLKAENERLAEERKELDAGKKTYYRLYEEERARNSRPVDQPKPDTSDRFWYNDDGSPKEMADFVAERVPLQEILQRAGVVTKAELNQQLDERVQREATKSYTLRDLATAYPEMMDTSSPLTQAAADEFLKLDPSLDEVTRWELATARAARRINYTPKAKSIEDTERERRRNGQGGPKGAINTKAPLTITAEMRREAKRMNGGQDVPDEILLATLKRQQQDRQTLTSRA